MMGLVQLFASNNWLSINRTLMRVLGLKTTVLLGELCSEYDYWEREGKLIDGMFYCSIEHLEEQTTLSRYEQTTSINQLKELGILEVVLKGVPATRYFKFNKSQFVNFLQTRLLETDKPDSEKLARNYNIQTRIKETKETLSKDKVDSDESSIETSQENIQETETNKPIRKRLFDTDDTGEEKPKRKKGNLFERCVEEAKNRYHDELLTVVLEYLNYRIKSKQHGFGFQAWVNLLNKLDALADFDQEKIKIVEQSLQMKWDTFAELRTWGRKTGCERFGETEDMRSGVPVGEVLDIQF